MPAKRPAADRFWEKVDRSGGPEACWPWLGASRDGRYGNFRVDNETVVRAHIYSCEQEHGPPPNPDDVVLHSCNNPPCCNPDHLSWGTQAQNVADMIAKGRAKMFGREMILEAA